MGAPKHHTVPLGKLPAKLVGAKLSSDGHPRLGAGVIVQAHLGLMSSEMLALEPEHVRLPWEQGRELSDAPVIVALG